MPSVEVRPFRRGDRQQLTALVNAHMQAVGMVNDHLVTCFRHKAVSRLK